MITEVSEAGQEDVDMAVEAARKAFDHGPWHRTMTGRDRGACLYRLADLIDQNREHLAQLEALNNGKTLSQARSVDAPACATILRYYAGWADKIYGMHIPISANHLNYTVHEPIGVCGLIIPWNLPLIGVAAKLGPALCTGNTVVLKAAENTPLTALAVAALVKQAGFPEGVINFVSGFGATTGAAICKHPLVDKISFTGSVATGKTIQKVAAESIKRTTLELGGNNPIVVCEDVDIDKTVATVHASVFWNEGEACAAGSRIFVHDKIYDEFVEKSATMAAARKVGNPFSEDSQQGAQVSEAHLKKIMSYMEGAIKDGATVVTGGRRVGDSGCYLEPTVFSDVTDDMKVFTDEVFGPVMTINRFSDVEDVIQRANNSEYGLACGVFTDNVVKGNEMVKRIRAGLMFWNCYHVVDISAPFGGMKQSGIGREGGPYGLHAYLEPKNVVQAIR